VSVLLTTITTTLVQIVADNAATGANANDIGGEIHKLANAGLMFTVAAIAAISMVPIARAIGGGAATEISGVTRWATSMMAAPASALGSAAVSGAKAGGAAIGQASAAGMRSLKAAGKAL
jgi:hypothetical protein